tara:strand:- start:1868 stop:2635 length:768 start_codon:yes stop_codon:yes gene_type:complete
MNKKRMWAFGCSYTRWCWPTWADYIGTNFEEYINTAQGGADNFNILHKFIKYNNKFKFGKDDYVFIMLTSFNRFSYVHNNIIKTTGDLVDNDIKEHELLKNFNFDTAAYYNCTIINALKKICSLSDFNFEILHGLPPKFLVNRATIPKTFNFTYEDEIIMDDWVQSNYDFDTNRVMWKNNQTFDGHPTLKHHFDFVKEFFPQYINENAIEYYNQNKKIFTNSSQQDQEKVFNKYREDFFINKEIVLDNNHHITKR